MKSQEKHTRQHENNYTFYPLIIQAEADLTKELRRAEDAKDEKNKMEILLLEVSVCRELT